MFAQWFWGRRRRSWLISEVMLLTQLSWQKDKLPEWMTFRYCFLSHSHRPWEDFSVNFVFHFSLRDEQWSCAALEDLLENIETDAFLSLYSQVSMKLNKVSKFKLQLHPGISFSCFLGTLTDVFGPSSANSLYHFFSLPLVLSYTSVNSKLLSAFWILLSYTSLCSLTDPFQGLSCCIHFVEETKLPKFLVFRQIYSLIFMEWVNAFV